MKYLPDSNAWIEAINDPTGLVASRLSLHPPAAVAFNSVSNGELRTGALRSANLAGESLAIDLVAGRFSSLAFDDPCAYEYARIRAHLEKIGQRIGAYDMQIAGIALYHGLIVVTHNVREFSRVPGLVIEDWQVP